MTGIKKQPKRRILHVVAAMNHGGIESWLMNVLRHIDRERYQIDFLFTRGKIGGFDEEIQALGSRIIVCQANRNPLAFYHALKQAFLDYGPYDCVHSHVHFFSGLVLMTAAHAGIPVRVAHSHTDTRTLAVNAGIKRRLYLSLSRKFIHRYATVGLAAGKNAAADLFGADWQKDARWRVLFCGIDLDLYRSIPPADNLRGELGLSPDTLVLGHVGRFDAPKNHGFLIEMAKEVARLRPDMRLLLVGDGPLRAEIEQAIVASGLEKQVLLLGRREDVPQVMTLMDVLVLPSLFEGLPLVLLEAQAVGLPVVYSKSVTDEADVAKELITRLNLQDSARTWADAILAAAGKHRIKEPAVALAKIEGGTFDFRRCLAELQDVYQAKVCRAE